MNWFFIILFYLFARARCETVFQNGRNVGAPSERQPRGTNKEPDVLASVREYPSLLHKCTATFITADVLLTTARCLYCENCHLFLHALSNHLTDEDQNPQAVSYNISKTVIHPGYERVPQKDDIGLIKLEQKVTGAAVFGLPKKIYDLPGLDVITYRWQFTPNYREYHLEHVKEKIISNALCSLILNRYVGYKQICTLRDKPATLGHFDQGTPLIATESAQGVDSLTTQGVIMGIYEREGIIRSSKVEVYDSIFPYIDWIQKIIQCNFNCTIPYLNAEKVQEIILSPTSSPLPVSYESSSNHTYTPSSIALSNSTTFTPVSPSQKDISAPEFSGHYTAQQPEPVIKEPNAMTGDERDQAGGLEPASGDNQRKTKPVKWTADFPFSEQKKAPFQPTHYPA